MRNISKQREPAELAGHRLAGGTYDDYREKPRLREMLVSEQKGLCCYCMNRIRPEHDRMKIEHWRSQRGYPELTLDYGNLLGACRGGENGSPELRHCDTYKADRDLSLNPAKDTVEERIRYTADGTIRSRDALVDSELDQVLNLNTPALKNQRKAAMDAILEISKHAHWRGRKDVLRQRLEQLPAKDPLDPFDPVKIWWLRQRGTR